MAKVVTKKPKMQEAFIVSAQGTDEDIRARCAESIAGWDDLQEASKADMIRLMRTFENSGSPPRMRIKAEGGQSSIGVPEGANVTLQTLRLVEAMGSRSQDYANERVADLANYRSSRAGANSQNLSADLAFVHGAKPEDPVQSSLLVQMAATHDAAMRALNRIGSADYAEHVQLFGNLANKLLNTYTRQAEALHKLQRGGESTVKVVHIDNRGGQAVVAEQFIKGASGDETRDHSHALSAPVRGEDSAGVPLSLARDPGEKAVPNAQRTRKGKAE
jgi:hypothetical protein